MIDSHIHIGQFYDIYTTSTELKDFLVSVGVDKCAISSTTICEENYTKVIDEIQTFISEFGAANVFPILWVTPKMLKTKALDLFLHCNIEWKCLKIHPQLHPKGWSVRGKNFRVLIELAREMHLPILVHTGADDCCHAGKYIKLINRNADINFILAHGRPLNETLSVLDECPNAYVDTAFMSVDSIVELCNRGFSSRVLWGSDVPIPLYFFRNSPSFDMREYYVSQIEDLKSRVSLADFELISEMNFSCVFHSLNHNNQCLTPNKL